MPFEGIEVLGELLGFLWEGALAADEFLAFVVDA